MCASSVIWSLGEAAGVGQEQASWARISSACETDFISGSSFPAGAPVPDWILKNKILTGSTIT